MGKWFRILKNKFYVSAVAILVIFPGLVQAQDSIPRNWSLNGYITNMQSFMFEDVNKAWISDNLLHNRLNFHWNSSSKLFGFTVDLRNRLISGESIKDNPNYIPASTSDKGWQKLFLNIASGNSYVLTSKIDRAYWDITLDKWQLRVGRQRINWGQCMVWNPNDLFNTYSFFDFDYIERPGSDAVRLQYYTGNTSSVEMAVKADRYNRITAAGLYRFNVSNYDIQLLAGLMNSEEYVLGAGWSGNIGNAAFTGEFSYFHPQKHFSDNTGIVAVSLGSNYTFNNSLTLQAEVLYNQQQKRNNSFTEYYNMDLSARNLSFSKYTAMVQASYP
ncbi:MAG: hypothetical protein PHX61_14260, partial [Alphaproteobacteria bacterium]|nr:hypothetical protein [Alphaproteobacteria bacterium]